MFLDNNEVENRQKHKNNRIIIIKKKKHRDGSVSISKERLAEGTNFSDTLFIFRNQNSNYQL